jgi:hypothetical protein
MAAQHLQLQRVVGVTFDDRAHHVRQLRIGDAVWLQIAHTNPFDPNAVVVLNSAGDQLGFIAAKNSARVRRHIEIHSLQGAVVEVSTSARALPHLVIKLAKPAVPASARYDGQQNNLTAGSLQGRPRCNFSSGARL